MISRISVPTVVSEIPRRALEYALENHPDPETTVLNVVGAPSPWWGAATGLAGLAPVGVSLGPEQPATRGFVLRDYIG